MKTTALCLFLALAACETDDPTIYDEGEEKKAAAAEEVRLASPGYARRIVPARANDIHLNGMIEVVECRILTGDPPYTDISIKNTTRHELDIEYRLHYFLTDGKETAHEDSLLFTQLRMDPLEVKVITSKHHLWGIKNVGIEIRKPFPE